MLIVRHPKRRVYSEMGQKVRSALQKEANVTFRVNSASGFFGPISGSSMDWAVGHQDAKIPFGFALELRDRGLHGFLWPEDKILTAAEDAVIINRVLAQELKKKLGG